MDCFARNGNHYSRYELLLHYDTLITHDANPKIDDVSLTLILRMEQGACCLYFDPKRQPISHRRMSATNCKTHCLRWKAKNRWHFVDAHFKHGAVFISHSQMRIKAANMLVMHHSDQIAFQLPYLLDETLLMLHWHLFLFIVYSQSAAIYKCIHNNLSWLVAFLSDSNVALWQSQAQAYYCIIHSHSNNIDASCEMIYFVCNTSVYQLIWTCHCTTFPYNISLNEFLSQAIWITWWNIMMNSVLLVLGSFFSCLFPLHWSSPTPFELCSVTSVLAESNQEQLVQKSHSAALGLLDLVRHCPAIYRM